jgi:phospholipid/cholesterol/gamma-HCH transport system substrate-binding protein
VRAPVRTAGRDGGPGQERSRSTPRPTRAWCTLESRRLQFPKDTSAKILTAGLLGDQYVGLEPGADDKNLAAGDAIKQTQSAVVLENLIGQFLRRPQPRRLPNRRLRPRSEPPADLAR